MDVAVVKKLNRQFYYGTSCGNFLLHYIFCYKMLHKIGSRTLEVIGKHYTCLTSLRRTMHPLEIIAMIGMARTIALTLHVLLIMYGKILCLMTWMMTTLKRCPVCIVRMIKIFRISKCGFMMTGYHLLQSS